MKYFEPGKPFGPEEAQRQIAIYGAELAAMATVAAGQYSNFDPPAAVICEPGTTETQSLAENLDPRVPIRIVEDGSTLAVLPRDALLKLIRVIAPDCEPYLDQQEFTGWGRLPVLAVCREGSMMGGIAYQPVV